MARELSEGLRKKGFLEVELVPTERAGHAEELAYRFVKEEPSALVVSVSGDGGYHEVVNGAMRAAEEQGVRPRLAVLGAGNANDHFRAMEESPLVQAIVSGSIRRLDLLRLRMAPPGQEEIHRFAHSYAGLGLSPTVAVELNRQELDRIKEVAISWQTLRRAETFAALVDGKKRRYNSLIFGNIDRMAKVLSLDPEADPGDGRFEVVAIQARGFWGLLVSLARSAILRPRPDLRTDRFSLTVIDESPIQLDGEIIHLPAGTRISVTSAAGAIETPLGVDTGKRARE